MGSSRASHFAIDSNVRDVLVQQTHHGKPMQQRRNTYRQTIPVHLATSCFIPVDEQHEIEIAVADISIGGLGLLGFNPDRELLIGDTMQHCRIELPLVGVIHCNLSVCTQHEILLNNGIKTLRTGCKILQLSKQNAILLQRYIFQLEQRLTNNKIIHINN